MKIQKTKIQKTIDSHIFDTCNIFFLLLLNFLFIYPFIYVFSISVSDLHQIAIGAVKLFPRGFQLEGYSAVFAANSIALAYWNTVRYSVTAMVITVLLTAMTAYPLSVKSLKGRSAITVFFAVTMFIGGGMIPTFLLIRDLHMLDTIWALVIPGSVSMWNLILVRTYFMSIPEDMRESARLDGASEWRILFQIIFPLSTAILVTIALFTLVGQWNSFFGPLIYLSDPDKAPLQLVLRKIIIRSDKSMQSLMRQQVGGGVGSSDNQANALGFQESIKMAAIMVSIGPIILMYPFAQKYFIKGIMVGAIKG